MMDPLLACYSIIAVLGLVSVWWVIKTKDE